jgi:prolyl oligopeptidase
MRMTCMSRTIALMLLLAGSIAHADAERDFARLLDDAWEWQLRENPVFASRLGDRRYNDSWTDLTLEAIERRQQEQRQLLARLLAIDSSELDETDRLNYDLFRRDLQNDIDGNRFRTYLVPISHRGGVQTLEETAEGLRLQSVQDYEDWLARMEAVDRVIGQTMELQERGRREGYMPPGILMERVPAQIGTQLVENAEESPFFAAFSDMPDTIPPAEQERLRAEAVRIIDEKIVPAYRKYRRYFADTYLPASRDSIGVSELPDGKEYYEYCTRVYTTTSMTPDEIHELGLSEVQRIRAEMQTIIDGLVDDRQFEGDFAEFLQFLRSDPRFYYDTSEELFEAYLATAKRIDPELVRLFGKLPRMPYGLRPIPENTAPDTTTAYYSRPAGDGSRAGYYYVNLYRPEVRPKYEIEVLTVHEAVPGHHLQIALAQELENVPEFRRYSGFTAFIEGWGLYSESLGEELGLYKDPYSKFGALTYEMWRAVRLVVDTGIHYKGWTRQQAIDFFKDNAAKTELDIVNEIDRYIGNPGQALAYKIGQLKILELKQEAQQALGDDFDIRKFHDQILGGGALPLEVLDVRMKTWLAEEMQARAAGRRENNG